MPPRPKNSTNKNSHRAALYNISEAFAESMALAENVTRRKRLLNHVRLLTGAFFSIKLGPRVGDLWINPNSSQVRFEDLSGIKPKTPAILRQRSYEEFVAVKNVRGPTVPKPPGFVAGAIGLGRSHVQALVITWIAARSRA